MMLLFAAFLAAQPVQPAPRADCVPMPQLIRSIGFTNDGPVCSRNSAEFRATVANLETAYRRACDSGLLQGGRLFRDVFRRDRIIVVNAPDANIASIYPTGVQRTGTSLQLEYPFMASDGSVNVPSADDLHEAIYCYVRGATQREQEEEGRCLPD
jgi:hypothetical protein